MLARTLTLLAGTVLALTASAGAYKWVDKDGVTHYGDLPPAGSNAESLELPKTPPASPEEVDEEARQAACDGARATLHQYETALEVLRPDASGKQVPLSEAERDQLIEQGRQRVIELCGEGE